MIVSSAVKKNGRIFTGIRHAECILKVIGNDSSIRVFQEEQGFVTDAGVFLSRKDAAEHAFICGQIDKKLDTLFSEDLW